MIIKIGLILTLSCTMFVLGLFLNPVEPRISALSIDRNISSESKQALLYKNLPCATEAHYKRYTGLLNFQDILKGELLTEIKETFFLVVIFLIWK